MLSVPIHSTRWCAVNLNHVQQVELKKQKEMSKAYFPFPFQKPPSQLEGHLLEIRIYVCVHNHINKTDSFQINPLKTDHVFHVTERRRGSV